MASCQCSKSLLQGCDLRTIDGGNITAPQDFKSLKIMMPRPATVKQIDISVKRHSKFCESQRVQLASFPKHSCLQETKTSSAADRRIRPDPSLPNNKATRRQFLSSVENSATEENKIYKDAGIMVGTSLPATSPHRPLKPGTLIAEDMPNAEMESYGSKNVPIFQSQEYPVPVLGQTPRNEDVFQEHSAGFALPREFTSATNNPFQPPMRLHETDRHWPGWNTSGSGDQREVSFTAGLDVNDGNLSLTQHALYYDVPEPACLFGLPTDTSNQPSNWAKFDLSNVDDTPRAATHNILYHGGHYNRPQDKPIQGLISTIEREQLGKQEPPHPGAGQNPTQLYNYAYSCPGGYDMSANGSEQLLSASRVFNANESGV